MPPATKEPTSLTRMNPKAANRVQSVIKVSVEFLLCHHNSRKVINPSYMQENCSAGCVYNVSIKSSSIMFLKCTEEWNLMWLNYIWVRKCYECCYKNNTFHSYLFDLIENMFVSLLSIKSISCFLYFQLWSNCSRESRQLQNQVNPATTQLLILLYRKCEWWWSQSNHCPHSCINEDTIIIEVIH